ncbi:hypothetical protein, partial [Campylobacter jejuni]|uniref:hypothetical protein n=1 Tax=Campylobacter jejuni TaxID=197 RepID=UPI00352AD56F
DLLHRYGETPSLACQHRGQQADAIVRDIVSQALDRGKRGRIMRTRSPCCSAFRQGGIVSLLIIEPVIIVIQRAAAFRIVG